MYTLKSCTLQAQPRTLRGNYTIELVQDIQAIYSINLDKIILDSIRRNLSHKERMQFELKNLQRKMSGHFKSKDQFKRVQMQQEIKRLKLHIKNHKKLYPEEYV